MDRNSVSGETPYTSFRHLQQQQEQQNHSVTASQHSDAPSQAFSPSPGGPIPLTSSSHSQLSQVYSHAQARIPLTVPQSHSHHSHHSHRSSRSRLSTDMGPVAIDPVASLDNNSRISSNNHNTTSANNPNAYYYDEVRNSVNAHAHLQDNPARGSTASSLGNRSSLTHSHHSGSHSIGSARHSHVRHTTPYQSDDRSNNSNGHVENDAAGSETGSDWQQQAKSVTSGGDHQPLIEIPEEVYRVRKAALQVLRPLTKTWLIVSVGFALTVLFGMARWTQLLMNLPYWFILLPSWVSHVGLFWCHIMSAKALSLFITEANDSRQRPDSRDHLDRTEYLPLLQRSLKFGLKTGLVSFGVFIFEILVYLRLVRGTISFTVIFMPLWILVTGNILDEIICKTQHFVRVICWLLVFTSMVLTVLKTDYGYDVIRWRYIVSPVVAVLTICSVCLIYIVYGHQIGYYRLTESQLTAGNLYSLAALVSIVLVIVVGEVIPLARPVEIETRIFVVVMAPFATVLVGMGAWVISRDEYGRLLIYGGQAAVHPRKLRWEANGWNSVQGRGVTNIPMFGEVRFQPLESKPPSGLESCLCCCSCYPYEDRSDDHMNPDDPIGSHPYLAPTPPVTPSPLTYTSPPDSSTASYQNQGV